MAAPVLVIVDVPGSAHAAAMAACVGDAASTPVDVRWLPPGPELPRMLDALRGVHAVALPVALRGATLGSAFAERLVAAITRLRLRGIPVYVAAGNRTPNPLAGVAISAGPLGTAADVVTGEPRFGSSGACVRAAALSLNPTGASHG